MVKVLIALLLLFPGGMLAFANQALPVLSEVTLLTERALNEDHE